MGIFKEAFIAEERIYADPLNPATSEYTVVLPITSTDAVVEVSTGKKLRDILASINTSLNNAIQMVTATTAGLMSADDKKKLDGIQANATNYVHPDNHAASMITGLSTVAKSGSYKDLSDKPVLNTFVIQSTPPEGDVTKLWINSATSVAHYWDGSVWKPFVGVWGEGD